MANLPIQKPTLEQQQNLANATAINNRNPGVTITGNSNLMAGSFAPVQFQQKSQQTYIPSTGQTIYGNGVKTPALPSSPPSSVSAAGPNGYNQVFYGNDAQAQADAYKKGIPYSPAITPYGGGTSQPSSSGGISNGTPNMQTPGGVNQSPPSSTQTVTQGQAWLNTDGTFKTDYKPSSDQEYQQTIDYLRNDFSDPNAQQKIAKITANYNGLNTGATLKNGQQIDMNPTSSQAMADVQNALNNEQSTYLDQQIAAAKAKANKEAAANTSAVQGNVGEVSREGVVSQGNQMGATKITNSIQKDLDTSFAQLDQQKQQLAEAQASGNTKLADQIGQNIASTQAVMMNKQIQYSQMINSTLQTLSSTGALTGMNPQQLQEISASLGNLPISALQAISKVQTSNFSNNQQDQQLNRYKTGLSVAQDYFINNGQPVDYQTAQKLSQQTGLSADSIMNLNQRAVQISKDNSLTQGQKQEQLKLLEVQAQNEQDGIFTDTQKQWSLYNRMAKSGNFSDEELSQYLQMNKMDSTQNPLTMLQMQMQKATTDKNYADIAQITATLNQMGYDKYGNPMGPDQVSSIANMPSDKVASIFNLAGPSKYSSILGSGNGLRECGEAYNQITDGTKVGSTYSSKMEAVTNRNNPQVGNGLVLPIGDPTVGHIGTVISVKNGVVTTVEWNRNLDGKPSTESYTIDDLNQKYGKNWGFTDSTFKSDYADKINGLSSGNTQTSKVDYNQYGKLANTDFNPDTGVDKYAKMYLDNYLKNGSVPPARALGLSTKQGALYANAVDRANDLYYQATGSSLPDVQILNKNKDLVSANNKLLNNLGIQEGTVQKNFQLALDNIDKNNINQGWQPVNDFLNKFQMMQGDPAVAQYITQNGTLQNELGSLLAVKNASGTTVADKMESAGLIPSGASEQQQKAILKTLLQEAQNATQSIKDSTAKLYEQIDPLEMQAENPNRSISTYQPKSQIIQNFLNDSSVSEDDKKNLRYDLSAGGYSESSGENAIKRRYGDKYADKSSKLVEDHHASTGTYTTPEDHPVNNYKF